MAIQTINLGATANDGTGDPLRTAFDKVNDNFQELIAPSLPASDNWVWLQAFDSLTLAGPTGLGANRLYASPFRVFRPTTITDIGVRVQTAVAASNFQLALYAAADATSLPTGDALRSTGNISGAATGILTAELSSALTLNPGIYWSCVNASAALGFQGASGSLVMARIVGSATATDILGGTAITANGLETTTTTFGTWPDLTAQGWTVSLSNANRFPAFLGQIQ